MRTTVDLPEPLLRALKARAALKGRTLASEVRGLIEAGLRAGTPPPEGRQGRRSAPAVIEALRGVRVRSMTNAQLARLEEAEDLERIARSR